jgi:acetyl-CoA hydrolase
MSILSGLKIVEIEGIGPGPFSGMMLADLGADVVTITRPHESVSAGQIIRRGKRCVPLDLKSDAGREAALELISKADALIEGMRPGVMERLGLGPDVCMSKNPRLAYGRLTGWGQDGPLAKTAGHDLNYIALSGALWYSGDPGTAPFAPPTLVGDLGGGALYLVIGLLSAILKARQTGKGDVIDAAIVDGSAHMMNLLLYAQSGGVMREPRGESFLDGSHWYRAYACKDQTYITIGSLEPQFYHLFLEKMGLSDDPDFKAQFDINAWPAQTEKLSKIFAKKTQREWQDLLEGTDVCFAPVLAPAQSKDHPHIASREIYETHDGVLQAAPAPRFSNHPAPETKAAKLASLEDILTTWV